jgi:hypothetical protein
MTVLLKLDGLLSITYKFLGKPNIVLSRWMNCGRGILWPKRKRKNVVVRQKKRAENVVATARKKRIN